MFSLYLVCSCSPGDLQLPLKSRMKSMEEVAGKLTERATSLYSAPSYSPRSSDEHCHGSLCICSFLYHLNLMKVLHPVFCPGLRKRRINKHGYSLNEAFSLQFSSLMRASIWIVCGKWPTVLAKDLLVCSSTSRFMLILQLFFCIPKKWLLLTLPYHSIKEEL